MDHFLESLLIDPRSLLVRLNERLRRIRIQKEDTKTTPAKTNKTTLTVVRASEPLRFAILSKMAPPIDRIAVKTNPSELAKAWTPRCFRLLFFSLIFISVCRRADRVDMRYQEMLEKAH